VRCSEACPGAERQVFLHPREFGFATARRVWDSKAVVVVLFPVLIILVLALLGLLVAGAVFFSLMA
jgi:hypothetical protein